MLEQNTVQCSEMKQYTGEERRNINFMFTMQCALLFNAIFVNLVSVFKINDAQLLRCIILSMLRNGLRNGSFRNFWDQRKWGHFEATRVS